MKKQLRFFCWALAALSVLSADAIDHKGITHHSLSPERFTLIEQGNPTSIVVNDGENSAVRIAASSLAADFGRVGGTDARLLGAVPGEASRIIIAGAFDGPTLRPLVKGGIVDLSELDGKNEQYIITMVRNPAPGVDEALVVAGSDRRGTVYGIYELSEQIGVSPWYDWADAPVARHADVSIERGRYTAGEPAVEYRGIFLNDEAPCLTGWVKNTYGTDYGNFHGEYVIYVK